MLQKSRLLGLSPAGKNQNLFQLWYEGQRLLYVSSSSSSDHCSLCSSLQPSISWSHSLSLEKGKKQQKTRFHSLSNSWHIWCKSFLSAVWQIWQYGYFKKKAFQSQYVPKCMQFQAVRQKSVCIAERGALEQHKGLEVTWGSAMKRWGWWKCSQGSLNPNTALLVTAVAKNWQRVCERERKIDELHGLFLLLCVNHFISLLLKIYSSWH